MYSYWWDLMGITSDIIKRHNLIVIDFLKQMENIPGSLNPAHRTTETGQKKWSSPVRTHKLVTQYEIVSHENISTNNMIQTKWVVFRKIYAYAYTHMHVTIIYEKKRPWIWKGIQRGIGQDLEGRKKKGKIM